MVILKKKFQTAKLTTYRFLSKLTLFYRNPKNNNIRDLKYSLIKRFCWVIYRKLKCSYFLKYLSKIFDKISWKWNIKFLLYTFFKLIKKIERYSSLYLIRSRSFASFFSPNHLYLHAVYFILVQHIIQS